MLLRSCFYVDCEFKALFVVQGQPQSLCLWREGGQGHPSCFSFTEEKGWNVPCTFIESLMVSSGKGPSPARLRSASGPEACSESPEGRPAGLRSV
jgi:hypothetical protein